MKKVIKITEADIEKLVKLVLEQEEEVDASQYDEMEYFDAYLKLFRQYLVEKKNIDPTKYPISYLLKKYTRPFLNEIGIRNDDEDDMDDDFRISRWDLSSYGRQIIQKGLVKVPSLSPQGTFKENFPKVLDIFTKRLDLPNYVKLEILEPKPFVLQPKMVIDYEKYLKTQDSFRPRYSKIEDKLKKFLKDYVGMNIESTYMGGVQVNPVTQNTLNDSNWFLNEVKKVIRPKIRQLPSSSLIHSIRLNFENYEPSIKLGYKGLASWHNKKTVKDQVEKALEELGYVTNKFKVEN